uniref:Uncharacterized protein isoform X1 n=1 Tax=Nicotiana tabacum TaxID=4097 RepID=A0A1S3ZWH5_TOBAC|nr:PREDICTED: uncharacterized protein LOC107791225 isoform X1 [Nicotiana tabacum]
MNRYYQFQNRVFRKQPLYLHDVGVRTAYILPSTDPMWEYTGDSAKSFIPRLMSTRVLEAIVPSVDQRSFSWRNERQFAISGGSATTQPAVNHTHRGM